MAEACNPNMVFKICEGISCFSFSVKELDVIVHKNYFLIKPYSFWAILYPTSLANLVVEVGTRHCHQTLFMMKFHTALLWQWQNVNLHMLKKDTPYLTKTTLMKTKLASWRFRFQRGLRGVEYDPPMPSYKLEWKSSQPQYLIRYKACKHKTWAGAVYWYLTFSFHSEHWSLYK